MNMQEEQCQADAAVFPISRRGDAKLLYAVITNITISDTMPQIYLRKDLYDALIKQGVEDVSEYVNELVRKALGGEE